MDCTEVEEGYKVRYTPLVPGEYYISLKYNGYHIVGSPFKVTCTGKSRVKQWKLGRIKTEIKFEGSSEEGGLFYFYCSTLDLYSALNDKN